MASAFSLAYSVHCQVNGAPSLPIHSPPSQIIKEYPQALAGTSSKLRPRHVYTPCLHVLPLLAATIGQQPRSPLLTPAATATATTASASTQDATGEDIPVDQLGTVASTSAVSAGVDALAASSATTGGSPPPPTTKATTGPGAAAVATIDKLLADITITPLAAVPLPPPPAGASMSFSALMAPGFIAGATTTDAPPGVPTLAAPPAPLLPSAPLTSLQSLQARNLHLPIATLQHMCLALFADSTIVDLRLVNCNLMPAHLQVLVNQISALSHIRCLYIDHNPSLSGSGPSSLSLSNSSSSDTSLWTQLVTSNPSLVLLSARGCTLADPVVTALAAGIKSHMCGLRVLCLARNKITRVGVEALADALLPRGPPAIAAPMGATPAVVVVGAQGPVPTVAITSTASIAPTSTLSSTPTGNASTFPTFPTFPTATATTLTPATTHTPPLVSLSLASNALTDESAFALARVLGKQPLTQDDASMRKKFFTELERLKIVEEEALLAQEMAGATTAGGKKAKAGVGAGGAGGAGKPGTARGGSAEERQAAGGKGGKGAAAAGAASPGKGGAGAGAAGGKGAGGLSAANANPATGGKPPAGSAVDVKGGGANVKKGGAGASAASAAAKKGGASAAGGKGKGGAGVDTDASVDEGASSANLDANGEPLEVISVPAGIDLDMFEQGGGYYLWGNRTLAHVNLSMNRLSVNAAKMFADAVADQMAADKNLVTSNMYATDPGLKERAKHGLMSVNLERNLFPTEDNPTVSDLQTAIEKKLSMLSAPSASNVPTPSASSRIQSAVKR